MTFVELSIRNKTKYAVQKRELKKLMEKAAGILRLKGEELSCVFLGPNEMARINRQYRGKSGPTDVLSFDYGEIFLCPSYIIKKHGLAKKELKKKIGELFVHGLVHIAGFDHKNKREESAMQKLEEKILNSLSLL